MRRYLLTVTLPIAGVIILTTAFWTSAGNLNPPAGPVAPTMKTLAEIEPRIAINATNTPGDATSIFKISQPGSYYLTGNVTGVAGKNGITIATIGTTTIDLNGHSLVGVPGSLDGLLGQRVRVQNGFAVSWGGHGICISQGILDRLHASNNGLEGIQATWGSIITDCTAEANGGDGIAVGDVSRIAGCVAKSNQGWGFKVDGACIVADCVVYANSAGGIQAVVGPSTTISHCMLFSSLGDAITVGNSCVVTGNHVVAAVAGIHATGNRSRIEGNTVVGCSIGFDVDGTDSVLLKNTASSNTTDYDIAAGNSFGPIVNVAGVGDISAIANADHPWANFAH